MTDKKMRIGVLALQGAFQLHQKHIEALGAEYVPVITSQDFLKIDGLILPGGESATMLKLIDAVGIQDTLTDFFKVKPVWGICAGAILMAKSVSNPAQKSFGVIDIEIERNAYGRQLESQHETIEDYEVASIRAPKIVKVGKDIHVLAKRSGDPTWLEFQKLMVTTFHPETNLSAPSPWHRRFLEYCFSVTM